MNRKLKLSTAGGTLTINGITATGNADVAISPSSNDFQPVVLRPGDEVSLDIAFEPTIGGPASTKLFFQTTDPANPQFLVKLQWMGDGPAVCFCVRTGPGLDDCEAKSVIDFGTVGLGISSRTSFRLTSCGTQPVTFSTVEVTNAEMRANFTGSGLPTPGMTLAPSDDPIEATLTFSPDRPKTYAGTDGGGRLRIETPNQQLSADLVGRASSEGCRLQGGPMSIEFGEGSVGMTSLRTLALENTGTEDCTFPERATITRGDGVRFQVLDAPIGVLPPGQTARVTLGYTPQDTVGPDSGEATIPVVGKTADTSKGMLVVALHGFPSPARSCLIEVQSAGPLSSTHILDFGFVPVYSTRVLPIALRNVGSAACWVANVKVVAGNLASPGVPASDFQIVTRPTGTFAPGAVGIVDVAFTPSALGSLTAMGGPGAYGINVTIETNDTRFTGQDCASILPGSNPIPGCIAWGLAASGGGRELTILPSAVDFGTVVAGCESAELPLTLYNSGTTPLQISTIDLSPISQPPIFTFVPGPVPFSLSPGDSRTLFLRYLPPDASPHMATLGVVVNGIRWNMGVRGQGTTDFRQTDIFSQSSTTKTDVLFVVDTAGTMGEEQLLLANSGQAFIEEAVRLGADFQIAFVSADMTTPGQSGFFQGSPRVITPSANASRQFAATVNALGTGGSGPSQGLEAMFRALSPPLSNNASMNGGFLRPDAALAVVVVSDRDDASPGSPDVYASFLRNLKGLHNESLASLSAIVGEGPNGCMSPNGQAVSGDRYLQVRQSTGGVAHSICSNDWLPIAANLAQRVFAGRSAFTLSQAPVANTIEVKINGVPMPSTDWSYDGTTNTVTFEPRAIPPAGATIVIGYNMMCL